MPKRNRLALNLKRLVITTLVLFATHYVVSTIPIFADECETPGGLTDLVKIDQCIDKFSDIADAISKANANNAAQLASLNSQVATLKNQIAGLDSQLGKLSEDIFDREVKRGVQNELLNAKVRQDYVRKRDQSVLLLMFSSQTAADFFRDMTYREKLAEDDQEYIASISTEIGELNTQATNLKAQQSNLDAVRKRVDEQAAFLAGEVKKAQNYVSDLSGKIAALSARQNEIITARSGSFIASIGDSELADDYNASIKGFRESAPSGSFAVFSFGGYTHRKGMSQYGARGRAQSGQNYQTILKAYYGKDPVNKDTGGTINVAGFGNLDFETTYLYGIAEMPSTWHPEALKAQAVAARTYAYRYKIQGSQICTTEACQVFRKSKSDSPPEAWKQAVDATRGQVLEDVVTYYSSTAGVYLTTMGWDTTDGGGGGNFVDKSYEKAGGSPWVYKAWYREGYTASGDTCGRANPWLNGEEMADIMNAALVLTQGSSEEASRITPVTTSCWGGNPYSHAELRNVASKYGGLSSASSVSVAQGTGTTNTVTINGVSVSGADFKKAFNLRAPGRLRIPQSGFQFFNIEKK